MVLLLSVFKLLLEKPELSERWLTRNEWFEPLCDVLIRPAFRAPPLSQGDTRCVLPLRKTSEIVAGALLFLRNLFIATLALVKDSFVKRLVLSSPTLGGFSAILCFCCKHAAKQFPMLKICKQRIYER